MPEYLKGNFKTAEPVNVEEKPLTAEEITTEEFMRRCREMQSLGNGLAGSVPYVDIKAVKQKFVAGETKEPEAK